MITIMGLGIAGLACGGGTSGDASTDTTSGASSGASAEEGSATASTAATASAEATTTGDTSASSGDATGGPAVACGEELSCSAPEVCVEERFEPQCEPYDPEQNEMCPRGTEASYCGGAGTPCCCAPTPASAHACVSPQGCDGAPTCACIACPGGKSCIDRGGGGFVCELPPQP